MSKINDGGSAFPLNTGSSHEPGAFEPEPGMSLRDYMAIHAPGLKDFVELLSIEAASEITGITAPDMNNTKEAFEFGLKVIAALRYQYADAMLAARSGGQDNE